MRTRSCLSYFGSDSEVAGLLAALINHCKHVTIPFAGGMSILPHLTARTVVANDLNNLAINFYQCLSGMYGDQLISMCQNTLSHPQELEHAIAYLTKLEHHTKPVERAWAYWVVCWVGRKGAGGCKKFPTKPSVRWTAEGGNNASRLQAAANDLEEWRNQFKRCEWLCEDYQEVLKKIPDKTGNAGYIDAPWPELGKNYMHTFDNEDHVDLEMYLRQFKNATILVRYGDHPLIRELYKDWHIIDAESRTQSNAVKGELWILNKTVA